MINDPPLAEDVPPRSQEIPIARPRCCATSVGSPLRFGETLISGGQGQSTISAVARKEKAPALKRQEALC